MKNNLLDVLMNLPPEQFDALFEGIRWTTFTRTSPKLAAHLITSAINKRLAERKLPAELARKQLVSFLDVSPMTIYLWGHSPKYAADPLPRKLVPIPGGVRHNVCFPLTEVTKWLVRNRPKLLIASLVKGGQNETV